MTDANSGVPIPAVSDESVPPRPAATVVIGRDQLGGPEVLVVRRSADVSFANAWTFPGGKVEPQDALDGFVVTPTLDEAAVYDPSWIDASKRAAVRETHEEVGIELQPDDLITMSHWLPPATITKRFATWFFWATLRADTEVVVDGSEIVDYRWIKPADAIAQLPSDFPTAPPTWVTLHDLSGGDLSGTARISTMVQQRRPPRFVTRLVTTDDGMVALWQDDAAYGSDSLEVDGPRHRLVMPKGRHRRYERTP